MTSVDAASMRFSRRPNLSPGFLVSNVSKSAAFRRAAIAWSILSASSNRPSMHSFRTASPDFSRATAVAGSSRHQAFGTTRHDLAAYIRSRQSGSSCELDSSPATFFFRSASMRSLSDGAAAAACCNAVTVSRRSVALAASPALRASPSKPVQNDSSLATLWSCLSLMRSLRVPRWPEVSAASSNLDCSLVNSANFAPPLAMQKLSTRHPSELPVRGRAQ